MKCTVDAAAGLLDELVGVLEHFWTNAALLAAEYYGLAGAVWEVVGKAARLDVGSGKWVSVALGDLEVVVQDKQEVGLGLAARDLYTKPVVARGRTVLMIECGENAEWPCLLTLGVGDTAYPLDREIARLAILSLIRPDGRYGEMLAKLLNAIEEAAARKGLVNVSRAIRLVRAVLRRTMEIAI